MEPVFLGLIAVGIVSSALSLTSSASEGLIAEDASPIFGVTIPQGYRQWELIAPAEEANPPNELRAVLGNAAAIKAYQGGVLPFPDGSILVKLAWRRAQSPEFAPASIPGAATKVEIMVKDLQRYSATGGGVRRICGRQTGGRNATPNVLCLSLSSGTGARLSLRDMHSKDTDFTRYY